MIKVSMFSDLHGNNEWPMAQPSAAISGVTDRMEDAVKVIGQVVDVAVTEGHKAVFFLGDLMDKRLADTVTRQMVSAAIRKAGERLDQIGSALYIIGGNHDAADQTNQFYSSDIFAAFDVPGVRVCAPGELVPVQDGGSLYNFWMVPYMALPVWRATVEAIQKTSDFKAAISHKRAANIILFHQDVLGNVDMGWTCDVGVGPTELAPFSYAFSGHFHTHQDFAKPANGFYLGAAMAHDFGDDPDEFRGFWTITFDNGKAKKFDKTPAVAPVFLTCRIDVEGDDVDAKTVSQLIRGAIGGKERVVGNYVRLVWHATAAAMKAIDTDALTARLVEWGARAAKHQPDTIYHHKSRLKIETDKRLPTFSEMAQQYIETPGVITEGLDKKRLAALGRDLLAQAEVGK